MKVKVLIAKYLGDDPQPGMVECHLVDAQNRQWAFIEKTPVVYAGTITAATSLPIWTAIACRLLKQETQAGGRELLHISTDVWGIESIEGNSEFVVCREALFDDAC